MFGGPRLASYRQRLSCDDFLVDRSLGLEGRLPELLCAVLCTTVTTPIYKHTYERFLHK